jgi:hypothetical protein
LQHGKFGNKEMVSYFFSQTHRRAVYHYIKRERAVQVQDIPHLGPWWGMLCTIRTIT